MFGFLIAHLLYAVGVTLAIAAINTLYNLYLHPLRSFPGPWYAKCSIAWATYRLFHGDHYLAVHALHLDYGPVVRITPNELSFIEAPAWREIYGHRGGSLEYPKDASQTFSKDPKHPHIFGAPREEHSKLRRLLAHGFSDKALREQEQVLGSYASAMIEGLKAQIAKPVDLVKWYNFTTYDVIAHLIFAESFDCLSKSVYHPWMETILSTVKLVTWTRAMSRVLPVDMSLLFALAPRRQVKEHNETWQVIREKLMRRKNRHVEYTDFMTNLLDAEHKGVLDEQDLLSNIPMLVVAGSETTATALSGTTYHLLKNHAAYSRLVTEIRTRFRDPNDINLSSINELKYLSAVIEEGLRMYPPANSNHPRVLPPQGATICGRFVPGGSLVGIPHYGCFRSPHNFTDPDRFIPERALGEDERYVHDQREAIQPFHLGPRNCIGRNLAYIEMRLVLVHLLLEFDLELQPESDEWDKQQVYSMWLKKPLIVRLRPVKNVSV